MTRINAQQCNSYAEVLAVVFTSIYLELLNVLVAGLTDVQLFGQVLQFEVKETSKVQIKHEDSLRSILFLLTYGRTGV